jgi:hypothetical protein
VRASPLAAGFGGSSVCAAVERHITNPATKRHTARNIFADPPNLHRREWTPR